MFDKTIMGYCLISGGFGAGYFGTFGVVGMHEAFKKQPMYPLMRSRDTLPYYIKSCLIGTIGGFVIGPLVPIYLLKGGSLPIVEIERTSSN